MPRLVAFSKTRNQRRGIVFPEPFVYSGQNFESSFSERLIVGWFALGNFGKVHPGTFLKTNGERESVAVKTLKSGNNSTGN